MRLIDADKAVPDIRFILDNLVGDSDWLQGYALGLSAAIDAICEAHTIDAVPVVHGRWYRHNKKKHGDTCYHCSVCEKMAFTDCWVWELTDYCPNCGAKMDGKDGADDE